MRKLLSVLATGFLLFSPLGAEQANQQSPYEITSDVIAPGGGTSSGGVYEVRNLVGQPSVGISSGGVYELSSGFLAPIGSTGAESTILIVR